MLRDARGAEIIAIAVVALIYLPAWHYLSDGQWRKDPFGRHLMFSDATLAAVTGLWATAFIITWQGQGLPRAFDVVSVAVLGVLLIERIWRFVIMVDVQRKLKAKSRVP